MDVRYRTTVFFSPDIRVYLIDMDDPCYGCAVQALGTIEKITITDEGFFEFEVKGHSLTSMNYFESRLEFRFHQIQGDRKLWTTDRALALAIEKELLVNDRLQADSQR